MHTSSLPPVVELLALYGPTASGKTGLSIEVALRLRDRGVPVVVISADSRQVYRHMDVGTSKTTPSQMRGIPHEMLDVAEPTRKLSLEAYTEMARERIRRHTAEGRLPFVVGGTGVYVGALVSGWDVAGTEGVRAALQRDFPPSLAADAYETLRRLDKAAAARVRPQNYEAVINALVRKMAPDAGQGGDGGDRALVLGLDPGARRGDRRIAETLDRQFDDGLFEEVVSLAERYGLDEEARRLGRKSTNQVLHTHGYREFFDLASSLGKPVAALDGAQRETVRRDILGHIQPYSRRQRSWFGKLPGVRMVESPDHAFKLIARRIGLPARR